MQFEFLKNSQVLRVVNFCSKAGKGSCRGSATNSMDLEKENEPLPRRSADYVLLKISLCDYHGIFHTVSFMCISSLMLIMQ